MKRPRIYILVKNFAGVNQDVQLFKSIGEAEMVFEKYTGFPFSSQYNNPESDLYDEKFSETKIYELDLPDFLELRKRNSNLIR